MNRNIYTLLLILGLSLSITLTGFADVNWAEMSNEEIEVELELGNQELLSRTQSEFELNVPILIKNKYGSYLFTLHGAHILGNTWDNSAKKKGDDCIMISIQGVCENIDCHWRGDHDYIPNYQIQQDIKATDQDGYSLEIYNVSSGDDGRYEVGADTDVGGKKRVSLIYYAYIDNTSVIISIPGYDGSIEIELKAPSAQPTDTLTPQPTDTPTPMPTDTPTPVPTETPTPTPKPTPTPVPTEVPINQSFENIQVGDIIYMGHYEQDNDSTNLREPIAWKIVSIWNHDQALAVSVYGLDGISYGKPMDTTEYMATGMSWENSYLRNWLNNDFYYSAFSESERERILICSVETKDKSGYSMVGDYVFVLNYAEANRYLKKPEDMACEVTPYALNTLRAEQGAVQDDGYGLWWLRDMVSIARVDNNGNFMQNTGNEAGYVIGTKGTKLFTQGKGAPVFCNYLVSVRPAMWIQLDVGNNNASPTKAPKATSKPTKRPTQTPRPTNTPKPKATAKPSNSSGYMSDSELIEMARGYFYLRGGSESGITGISIDHKGDVSYVTIAYNFHCYVIKLDRKTGRAYGMTQLF